MEKECKCRVSLPRHNGSQYCKCQGRIPKLPILKNEPESTIDDKPSKMITSKAIKSKK